MKILVSGTKSGLGKYIFNEIGTHRYKRNVNLNGHIKLVGSYNTLWFL